MTERELMRLLKAVHELDIQERERRYAEERAHCLLPTRVRTALLREDWTEAEREHLRTCTFCQAMRDKLQPRLWFPSLWQLVLYRLGRLTGDEAEAVARHLERDRCRRSLERLRQIEAVQGTIAALLQPIALPKSQMAHAHTTEPLNKTLTAPDQRFEAQLVEDDDQIVLEVRTKLPELNYQLFGYALTDTEGHEAVTGFLVLRPDVNDWYAGTVNFQREALAETLKGQCREVVVNWVEPSLLTPTEQEALLASLERDWDDEEARSAWQAWVEKALQDENLPDEARQLLQQVHARLGE
ncbi:MAG: hypothetical protein SNJ72_01640 [Fimbriimonadales bacterium]